MNKQLQSLMQKEVTRREFLATMGFGLASLMGFSSIIKLLTGKSGPAHLSKSSMGYGSSSYGGNREA